MEIIKNIQQHIKTQKECIKINQQNLKQQNISPHLRVTFNDSIKFSQESIKKYNEVINQRLKQL